MPAWAAGFSAFGCACGDYAYRYDLTIDMPIEPTARRRREGRPGDLHRRRLADAARARAAPSSPSRASARTRSSSATYVRMQYLGQLNDLEIHSPHQELSEGSQVDDLIAAFEEAYGKLYARSARSPELGYWLTNVIVTGAVPVEKPALPNEEVSVSGLGCRERRPGRSGGTVGGPTTDDLRAGRGAGRACDRGPGDRRSRRADTFAIPPGRKATLDRAPDLASGEQGAP